MEPVRNNDGVSSKRTSWKAALLSFNPYFGLLGHLTPCRLASCTVFTFSIHKLVLSFHFQLSSSSKSSRSLREASKPSVRKVVQGLLISVEDLCGIRGTLNSTGWLEITRHACHDGLL